MQMSAARRERGVVIAGNGGGLGAAGASIFNRGDHVGRAATGRETDDHVLARRAAAGNIALPQFGRILVHFDRRCQGLRASGHDVLNALRRGGKGGRALGGVEAGDAAAGSGANVDQAPSVAQAARHHVDDQSNLGQRLLNRGGNLRIFVVDDAGDFKGRFGVEAHRGFVRTFRRKIVQVLRLIVTRLAAGACLRVNSTGCGHVGLLSSHSTK